jgi:hypothetical protein
MLESLSTRRNFLRSTSVAGASLLLPVLAVAQQKAAPEKQKDKGGDKKDEDISPAEDLMREHGLLNRLLLIYDEHLRMLKEDKLFGEEGFFKVVDQVAGLEKKLGIYELAQFTPE